MKNIALIGIGFIGQIHAKAITSSKEGLRLVAICGADIDKDREAASKFDCDYYTDIEEMLQRSDINIVDVCTPTFTHEHYVVMAAKAGKHVVCEKPFGLSVQSVDTMIDACKNAGVKLMVAQVVRFMGEYLKMSELIKNNKLGKIRTAHFRRLTATAGRVLRNVKWYDDPAASGGALFDLQIHDLDYACSVFGKPIRVYSIGCKSPSGCWDEIFNTIEFENGAKVCIESSSYMPEKYPFTMSFRVCGDDGCAEYKAASSVNTGASMQDAAFVWYPRLGESKILPVEEHDSYQKELEYFAQCVAEDREPDFVPFEQSRDVIKITLAIKESLENNCVIDL